MRYPPDLRILKNANVEFGRLLRLSTILRLLLASNARNLRAELQKPVPA